MPSFNPFAIPQTPGVGLKSLVSNGRPWMSDADALKMLLQSQAASLRGVGGGRGGGGSGGGRGGATPRVGDLRYGSWVELPKADGTKEMKWVWGKGAKDQAAAKDEARASRLNEIINGDSELQGLLKDFSKKSLPGQKETLEKIRTNVAPRLAKITGLSGADIVKATTGEAAAINDARQKEVKKSAGFFSQAKYSFGTLANNIGDFISSIGKTPQEKLQLGNAAAERERQRVAENAFLDEQQRLAGEKRSATDFMLGNLRATIGASAAPLAATLGASVATGGLGGAASGALGLSRAAGALIGSGIGGGLVSAPDIGGENLRRAATDPNIAEADRARAVDEASTLGALYGGIAGAIPVGPAALGRFAPQAMREAAMRTALRRAGTVYAGAATDAAILGAAQQIAENVAYNQGTGQALPITEGVGEQILAGAALGVPFGIAGMRRRNLYTGPNRPAERAAAPEPAAPETITRAASPEASSQPGQVDPNFVPTRERIWDGPPRNAWPEGEPYSPLPDANAPAVYVSPNTPPSLRSVVEPMAYPTDIVPVARQDFTWGPRSKILYNETPVTGERGETGRAELPAAQRGLPVAEVISMSGEAAPQPQRHIPRTAIKKVEFAERGNRPTRELDIAKAGSRLRDETYQRLVRNEMSLDEVAAEREASVSPMVRRALNDAINYYAAGEGRKQVTQPAYNEAWREVPEPAAMPVEQRRSYTDVEMQVAKQALKKRTEKAMTALLEQARANNTLNVDALSDALAQSKLGKSSPTRQLLNTFINLSRIKRHAQQTGGAGSDGGRPVAEVGEPRQEPAQTINRADNNVDSAMPAGAGEITRPLADSNAPETARSDTAPERRGADGAEPQNTRPAETDTGAAVPEDGAAGGQLRERGAGETAEKPARPGEAERSSQSAEGAGNGGARNEGRAGGDEPVKAETLEADTARLLEEMTALTEPKPATRTKPARGAEKRLADALAEAGAPPEFVKPMMTAKNRAKLAGSAFAQARTALETTGKMTDEFRTLLDDWQKKTEKPARETAPAEETPEPVGRTVTPYIVRQEIDRLVTGDRYDRLFKNMDYYDAMDLGERVMAKQALGQKLTKKEVRIYNELKNAGVEDLTVNREELRQIVDDAIERGLEMNDVDALLDTPEKQRGSKEKINDEPFCVAPQVKTRKK